MRRIEISESPLVCEVIGFLYESDDPAELGQDMLEVVLRDGILIDAGWYPEGDPHGSYVVSVTRGLEDLTPPRTTTDAVDAARIVNEWIEAFGRSAAHLTESRAARD